MTTILFLADPQQSREPIDYEPSHRRQRASKLNIALNDRLDRWPKFMNLSVELADQPISINAVFFGGDLTQAGGGYDSTDQFARTPATYHGGKELASVQSLYVRDFDNDGLVKLRYEPKYFGLGNHDVEDKYHPLVGWEGNSSISTKEDYFRYQMYNFIAQMHGGGRNTPGNPGGKEGTYPMQPDCIDAEFNGHNPYDWKNYSMNYFVDLGPVDVFQLHWFGGCVRDGHASGIQWLKDRLEERGTDRPIIIVQHAAFWPITAPGDGGGVDWTYEEKMALLEILKPYNIIALLTGHKHVNKFNQAIPVPGRSDFREFNVGTATVVGGSDEPYSFALIHVTPIKFDILYGRSNDASTINWTNGISILIPGHRRWVDPSPANDEYFGPLNTAFYAESSPVECPAGKVIRGVAFYKHHNRLAPKLLVTNPDDTEAEEVASGLGDYFPTTDGLEWFYVDLNPVSCPSGYQIDYLFIYQKGNRIAPGISAIDSKGNRQRITNDDWNSNYTGPGKDKYAKTTVMFPPKPEDGYLWVLVGWAFTDLVPGVGNQIGTRLEYEMQHPRLTS